MNKRPHRPGGKRPPSAANTSKAPKMPPHNAAKPPVNPSRKVSAPPRNMEESEKAGFFHSVKGALHNFGLHVFYSRDRIFCGVVCVILMSVFALLQTTIFSAVRPFGAVPDLMISFVVALAVTEGERWGAVFGIISAVIIEGLGLTDVTLLPLLYMPVGYFCGVFCKYYFTGSAAVRCVMTLSVLPLRAIFTSVYIFLSPMVITVSEAALNIVLPEISATLFLAAPVHLLVYICLRPFHRTRAEMVSEK